METDPLAAQAALDVVAAAERRSAEIATSTPWYAPWYGATCAVLPIALALLAVRSGLGVAVFLLNLASMALLTATYRRVTGVWPSGRGMTVHYVAAAVVMAGAGVGSFLVAGSFGLGWWLPAVAVVTAVLMALVSRSFDFAYARTHGAR